MTKTADDSGSITSPPSTSGSCDGRSTPRDDRGGGGVDVDGFERLGEPEVHGDGAGPTHPRQDSGAASGGGAPREEEGPPRPFRGQGTIFAAASAFAIIVAIAVASIAIARASGGKRGREGGGASRTSSSTTGVVDAGAPRSSALTSFPAAMSTTMHVVCVFGNAKRYAAALSFKMP